MYLGLNKENLAGAGPEPTTFGLTYRRSTQSVSLVVCYLAFDVMSYLQVSIILWHQIISFFFLHAASRVKIRWFTPTNEVNLCGHATLASAAALFYVVGNRCDAIRFQSKSGELIASREGKTIGLDFPLNKPSKEVVYHSDFLKYFLEHFKLVTIKKCSKRSVLCLNRNV